MRCCTCCLAGPSEQSVVLNIKGLMQEMATALSAGSSQEDSSSYKHLPVHYASILGTAAVTDVARQISDETAMPALPDQDSTCNRPARQYSLHTMMQPSELLAGWPMTQLPSSASAGGASSSSALRPVHPDLHCQPRMTVTQQLAGAQQQRLCPMCPEPAEAEQMVASVSQQHNWHALAARVVSVGSLLAYAASRTWDINEEMDLMLWWLAAHIIRMANSTRFYTSPPSMQESDYRLSAAEAGRQPRDGGQWRVCGVHRCWNIMLD